MKDQADGTTDVDGNPDGNDGAHREGHSSYSIRAVEALFQGALERPSGPSRDRWLRRAAGGDDRLYTEVIELLGSHRTSAGFLERGALLRGLDEDLADAASAPTGAEIGDRLGPYELVEVLGEGGFGTVYRAVQEVPVRREVALKIIKLGMDTRQVIARFEAERQALAVLDHPSIARVLDAGATESGRPYFVMDLAPGEDLDHFCDKRKLTIRQRLDVFLVLCSAVQHAHQRGIIHRDLKPSNVLVAETDGHFVPKVIDFGIAKAIRDEIQEGTLFTQAGQVIGTPVYMSPEQATGSSDIDTRTDVYSLGVILYQLLSGVTPLATDDLRARGGATDIGAFLADFEPVAPSLRLTQGAPSVQSEVAARRGGALAEVRSAVRGDLDHITLCALEADRDRRYESAAALARDVERALENRPIEASSPSPVYRVRKFLRRHRVLAVAVGAVLAAIVAGSFVAINSLRAKRDQAVVLLDIFSAATGEGGAKSVLSTAAEIEARTATAFGKDAPIVVDALATLGDRLGRNGATEQSLQAREQALAAAIRIHGQDAYPTTLARAALGLQFARMGARAKASEVLREAVAADARRSPPGTPAINGARVELARLLADEGDFAEAEALAELADDIARTSAAMDRQLRADALEVLVDIRTRSGDDDGAREAWRGLLATYVQLSPKASLFVPRRRIEFGRWLASIGRPGDAARELRRALNSLRALEEPSHELEYEALVAFNTAATDSPTSAQEDLALTELDREVELADSLFSLGSATHSEALRRVASHFDARGNVARAIVLLVERYEAVAAAPPDARTVASDLAHETTLSVMREGLVAYAYKLRKQQGLPVQAYEAALRAVEIALQHQTGDDASLLVMKIELTVRSGNFMAVFSQIEEFRETTEFEGDHPLFLAMEAVAYSQVLAQRGLARQRLDEAKELAKEPRFLEILGLEETLRWAESLVSPGGDKGERTGPATSGPGD